MDRQIIYSIIAGRQLDHSTYKMMPQTALQFCNSYAQYMDRVASRRGLQGQLSLLSLRGQ